MQNNKKQKSSHIVKIVVVGDGACGKTCLLEVFKKNSFPEDYIPTVVDNFSKDIEIENDVLTLNLWDTAGQEEYDSVRPLAYRDAELIFLCFSIESRNALQNIQSKWIPEIKNYCPNAGTFLVGLKKDIRELSKLPQFNEAQITGEEEGKTMKDRVEALEYVEVSSKKNEFVYELFEMAGSWFLKNKRREGARRRRWYFCFCC